MNPTLRTERNEKNYQDDIAAGNIGDISSIPAPRVGGLKIMENQYPYDIAYSHNDMVVGMKPDFWDFWVKLGQLIEEDKLGDYAQVIFNLPRYQSQPHVPHAHIVKFKEDREDFSL